MDQAQNDATLKYQIQIKLLRGIKKLLNDNISVVTTNGSNLCYTILVDQEREECFQDALVFYLDENEREIFAQFDSSFEDNCKRYFKEKWLELLDEFNEKFEKIKIQNGSFKEACRTLLTYRNPVTTDEYIKDIIQTFYEENNQDDDSYHRATHFVQYSNERLHSRDFIDIPSDIVELYWEKLDEKWCKNVTQSTVLNPVNVVYDEETHEQSILHLHDEIYNTLVLDEIAYHLTKKTDMFIDELFDLIQE